jgi:uncharacterized protein (DUF58 family)
MPWLPKTRQASPGPSDDEIDAAAMLRRARRLQLQVGPEAISTLSGAYHSARPGAGLTFSELRAYEPGDDVRHLDWNVTARQGRPYVRRFVEERALTLWLLLDVSASLRFGSESRTKADRAAQAAALLAAAAVQNGDRVGLLLISNRIEAEYPPRGGIRQLSRIFRALIATPSVSLKTDLSAGLKRLSRISRHCLIVVFSDFLTPEPVPPWRAVATRHHLVAARVVDPLEEQLPTVGLLSLRDLEGQSTLEVDTGDARVEDAYRQAAARRRQAFSRWCAETGAGSVRLSTGDDPILPLLRYFHTRAARAASGSRR